MRSGCVCPRFNHRLSPDPVRTGHNKLTLLTPPQTVRFPVKEIFLLTVCLEADSLQESHWQHLFISECQREKKRERGRDKEIERRRMKREEAQYRGNGKWVCFNNRVDLPLALKHFQIIMVAISEIHLASDWMSTDVFITLVLIICLTQHSLPSTRLI